MRKLIHFPLSSDTFGHQFGIKSLDKENQITKRTHFYKDEIRLKMISSRPTKIIILLARIEV